jgi:hypothetical protein
MSARGSSLHATVERDADGNVLRGDVIAADTRDSFVFSESRLVATLGLEGHVVVETKDAVWLRPKIACRTSSNWSRVSRNPVAPSMRCIARCTALGEATTASRTGYGFK